MWNSGYLTRNIADCPLHLAPRMHLTSRRRYLSLSLSLSCSLSLPLSLSLSPFVIFSLSTLSIQLNKALLARRGR